MGKRRQPRKVYGRYTHYWRPEMKPLLLPAANYSTKGGASLLPL